MIRRRDLLAWLALLKPSAFAAAPTSDAGVPSTRFPHGRPIVSFATSPNGRFLVTGAECSDLHADDPVEGVACWDLRDLSLRWTTQLPGGVGLAEQLKGGVGFSPDGRLVGANSHTNAVTLLDASTGRVLRTVELSQSDGAPAWCWSSNSKQPDAIVLSAQGHLFFAPVTGAVQQLPSPNGWPLIFDSSGLTTVVDGALTRGSSRIPLRTANGARVISVAISPTALVVGTEPGEVLVIDPVDFVVRTRLELGVQALSVSPRNDVVLAFGRRDVSVVRNGKIEPLQGPLVTRDWLQFADGRPAALSGDGARVVTVGPAGEVDELTGGRRRRLAVVPGAESVSWPCDDRILAIGPRVVAVIEPGRGTRWLSRL